MLSKGNNRSILALFVIMAAFSAVSLTGCPNPAGGNNPGTADAGFSGVGNIAVAANGDVYIVGGYRNNACYWKNGVRIDLPASAETSYSLASGIAVTANGDVYISGAYSQGISSFYTACYWKNGVWTDLPLPAGAIYSGVPLNDGFSVIAVAANGDVYILGYYGYDNYNETYCYWKNGALIDLPVPAGHIGRASGIAVTANEDVYVSGFYEDINYNITPCYWKNEVRIDLSVPTGHNGGASGIAVTSKGDVYICGRYSEDDNTGTSCYWKNGALTDLPVPAEASDSGASGIAVAANGDICISGYYRDANYNFTYCYWKNGTLTDLSIPAGAGGGISGIAVTSKGDVYISGSYSLYDETINTNTSTRCYWKNGALINLPAGDDYFSTSARNIAVAANGDVYIAGSYSIRNETTSTDSILCYWKNGARTELPFPAGARGPWTSDIIVAANGDACILGYYRSDDDYYRMMPCYWKNGARTDLSFPAEARDYYPSGASGIAVTANGDIHILGYYGDANNNDATCYWKNGALIDLPFPARTSSFSLAGITGTADGDVYISGYYHVNNNTTPTLCYWKNGVRTDLSDSPVPAGAYYYFYLYDIAAAANGDVYIFGYYRDSNYNGTYCYWKNGVRTDLSDLSDLPVPAGTSSFFWNSDIVIANGDICILGGYSSVNNDYNYYTLCYWKNGVRTDLSGPAGINFYDSFFSDIAVTANGDIHILGSYYDYNANNDTTCYWKNGALTDLPVPAGTRYFSASGITITANNDVYIAGSYSNFSSYLSSGISTACYWKNGVRIDISE